MVMRAFSFWQLTVVATKLTSSIIQSALFKLSVPRTKYELDPNLRKSLEEPRTGKLNNGGPISSRPLMQNRSRIGISSYSETTRSGTCPGCSAADKPLGQPIDCKTRVPSPGCETTRHP